MSKLVYDLNNDNKVTTADVVYFASALIDNEHYNVDFNTQVTNVNGLFLKKVSKQIPISSEHLINNIHETITNLSISTTGLNSSFLININLNYLTSNIPDTYINLELYYQIGDEDETKFAETILGSGNAILLKNNFNYNNIMSVNRDVNINENINFIVKSKYINENNIDIDDNSKPKILLNTLGNNISILEMRDL